MGEDIIALCGIFFIFGVIPVSVIWTHHRRKMLELQLRLRQDGDSGVRAALEALRQEVRMLKETTTEYDISFDNALQRMEQRVDNLERRGSLSKSEDVANLRVGS